MIVRRLIELLAVTVIALHAGQAGAQGTFPAPLPNQSTPPPASGSPFPPGNAAPGIDRFAAPPISVPSEVCTKEFTALREEAEKRSRLVKAASERKASPEEACKLISGFGAAEIKMIQYAEANAAKCAIPPRIADQLKAGHNKTEVLQRKVCNVAQQMQRQSPFGPPQINDVGDPVMEKPPAPLPKPHSGLR